MRKVPLTCRFARRRPFTFSITSILLLLGVPLLVGEGLQGLEHELVEVLNLFGVNSGRSLDQKGGLCGEEASNTVKCNVSC